MAIDMSLNQSFNNIFFNVKAKNTIPSIKQQNTN